MSASNCDLLSNMPDEILHRILSFLPTPDSVRTSILSPRWRHLWRCVPAFHFDIDEHFSPDEVYHPEATTSEEAKMVYQFITGRDAACPLLRFHLHIHINFPHQTDPVSDWVSYAGSHGVRDMLVHVLTVSNAPPPSTFFNLPSIEALELKHSSHFFSSIFPQHIALSKLKTLTLHFPRGSFADQSLSALLSSLPSLQELTFYRGVLDDVVNITSHSVRRLTFVDRNCSCEGRSYKAGITCPNLEYLCLSSSVRQKRFHGQIPSLREASIEMNYTVPQATKQFTQIFETLRSVTKLTLRLALGIDVKLDSWCFLKHMTGFPMLRKLTQLKFCADIGEDYVRQVLLCFIMHSPYLSSLEVIDEPEGSSSYTSNTCQRRLRISSSLKALDHLKKVTVEGIHDEENRREVLQMLSKHVNEWERVAVIG